MDWKILTRADIVLVASSTIIILVAISIAATLEPQAETSGFKIITVGPVWEEDSWICTSNADFMIFGTLRGVGNSQISINISDKGTQSLYSLVPGELETFSVGGQADDQIIITRTGTVTGFITLQTSSDAKAGCI